jgi:NAD(P)-dependent dehydrogenase (short-subunit alcohol dehydrogenase family)
VKKKSPFELAIDLQGQVGRLVRSYDIDSLPAEEREVLMALKRQAAEVRLDMRDYGLAETVAAQKRLAAEARARLQELDTMILNAGSLDLIGAADVAQFSAIAQQLMSDL